ncbi:MAG: hypothetical protein PHY92_04195 [Alphaproteobacteria bacterium]|nr:hypothetical protein [Alphaproteobacteria bacterium]
MKISSALFTVVVVIILLVGGFAAVHNDHLKNYRDMESVPSPDVYDMAQGALTASRVIPPTCGNYEARKSILNAFMASAPSWLTKVPNVLNPRPEKYDFPAKMFDCAADLTLALSPEEANRFDRYLGSNEFAVAEFPLFKSIEGLAAALTRDENAAADYLMHDKIKKKEIELVNEPGRILLVEKIHYSVAADGREVHTDYIAAELKAYSKLLDKIH